MFHSIRSKIMAIIVLIVAVSTVSTIFFSKSLVQHDKIISQDTSVSNMMRLAMLFIEDENKDLVDYEKMLMDLRKRFIKDNANILIEGLNTLAGMVEDKKMTLDEAQEKAKEYIRQVRFGDDDYFFAYNMDFVNLAHPNRSMEGRDLSQHKDVKGTHYAPDLISMAKTKGEGFKVIWWEKLGQTEPVPKLLYVRLFPQWNWLIGTGIYIDDIQEMVDEGRRAMVQNLRSTLNRVRLADTGEVFIFRVGQKLVVSPRFMGTEVSECVDAETGRPVLDVLEDAAEKGTPRVEMEVSGPGGFKANLIFFVRFFRPLKWVVVSFVPEAELLASVNRLVMNQILANLAILFVTLVIAILVVRRICRPFTHLAEAAQFIARGDIRGAREEFAALTEHCGREEGEEGEEDCAAGIKDETGRLYEAFRAMADNLNSLVGQVKRAEGMVADQADDISGAVARLDDAILRQAKSTGEVGVQATQITSLAGELAGTMNEVSNVAHDTAVLAEEGLSGLDDIDNSMARLKQATEAISSKLTVINDKAGNIGQVVTTISKVSEKTNLLSLNASIEAEKAGEYGQGFAVVAREIRKLADQTDIATLDIKKIVGEMRSAVSAGVMEMDKFGREVELNAADIARISDRISGIIGHVRSLEPSVLSVNDGMQAQSKSAESITNAIVDLGQSAEETKNLLGRFVQASGRLSDSIESLKEEISKFEVESTEE